MDGGGDGVVFFAFRGAGRVAVAALRQPYTACVMSCAPTGLGNYLKYTRVIPVPPVSNEAS